jgi:diguanylate cyclase (GGDEF)-like protein
MMTTSPPRKEFRLTRRAVLAVAAILVVLAGIGDYVSADDVAFTLVYLAPVALAAWEAGRTSGMVVAAAAAVCALLGNLGHVPPLSPVVQFWNLLTDLGVFATVAALLASLKQRLVVESERALTDVLTGLKNRRGFQEAARAEIERARRHQQPFTLALLDLDDFKRVNDTLGHGAGDDVLVAVSRLLRERLRVVDVVCRVGGDEFALLLPETVASEAATAFRDLLVGVSIAMRERGWPVGLSVGAVTFNSAPPSLDDALRETDTLLYEAKRAGKGQARHETFPSTPR